VARQITRHGFKVPRARSEPFPKAETDGRQPPDLTADKLLAHSRLPLAWHKQRTALGFA